MLSKYCFDGFPHSEICGSTAICASPQLIAACHVLLRLLMPRHSPCALFSLTFVGDCALCSAFPFGKPSPYRLSPPLSKKRKSLFGIPFGLFSRVQAPLVSTILLRNIVCTASLFLLFPKSLWTFWEPFEARFARKNRFLLAPLSFLFASSVSNSPQVLELCE